MCGHFYWKLKNARDWISPVVQEIMIGYMTDEDGPSVARVFFEGLRDEEGSPWDGWLARQRITSKEDAGRWLSKAGGLRGRILVAKKSDDVVGMCGLTMVDPELMRVFTGVIVSPPERRRGIGSLLLYRSLVEAEEAGASRLDLYTITGIPAARYLYPKFGGIEDEKD